MKLFTCAYCLYAVNILTVLVANLMVAFGIFALTFLGVVVVTVNTGSNLQAEGVNNDIRPFIGSEAGAWLVIVSAFLVLACSLLGCFGAVRRNKCFLFVYFLFLALFCLLMFVGAGLVHSYAGAAATPGNPAAHDVSNLVVKSFDSCCSLPKASANGTVIGIGAKTCSSSGSDTTTSGLYTCYYPACPAPNNAPCAERFGQGDIGFTASMCNTIQWLAVGSEVRRQDTNCGIGRAAWSSKVSTYITGNLQLAGTLLLAFAVIMFLLFVWGVIVWCFLFVECCMRCLGDDAAGREVDHKVVVKHKGKRPKSAPRGAERL